MALPANALTTVPTLELELGLKSGSQTPLLERAVGLVSDAIERYCQRKFARVAVVNERVRGFGTLRLMLDRTPIDASVPVIVVLDTVTLDSSGYYVENAESGFLFRSCTWQSTAALSSDIVPRYVPGTEERAYLVSYTGGYYLPSDAVNRTLPFDLEQAAIIGAVSWFRGRGKYSRLVAETENSDSKLWYDYMLPPNARQLLVPYRRLVQS